MAECVVKSGRNNDRGGRLGSSLERIKRWLLARLRGRPPREGASREIIVYTRAGCHLCDDATAVLRRHGLEPRAVDIDADAELAARYTDCVPVVVIDGQVRFRGRVNEVLLRRILRHPGILRLRSGDHLAD